MHGLCDPVLCAAGTALPCEQRIAHHCLHSAVRLHGIVRWYGPPPTAAVIVVLVVVVIVIVVGVVIVVVVVVVVVVVAVIAGGLF